MAQGLARRLACLARHKDPATHVDIAVKLLWTRVQFPPPPPSFERALAKREVWRAPLFIGYAGATPCREEGRKGEATEGNGLADAGIGNVMAVESFLL